MSTPTNTCTVTFADAHSHTFVSAAIAAGGGNPSGNVMATKLDALLSAAQGLLASAPADFAAFTQTDTLTVTVTQP
jgi:hypothetical protein